MVSSIRNSDNIKIQPLKIKTTNSKIIGGDNQSKDKITDRNQVPIIRVFSKSKISIDKISEQTIKTRFKNSLRLKPKSK